MSEAVVLLGGYWCKNPGMVVEVARRGLHPLVIDEAGPRVERERCQVAADPDHPLRVIHDPRFVASPAVPEVLELVRHASHDHRIRGVHALREEFVEAASVCADYLRLPAPGLTAGRVCRDKRLQRSYLHQWSPASTVLAAGDPVDAAVARVGGCPVVVKRVDGCASLGVRVCWETGEVVQAAAGFPVGTPLLVEELVQGAEISVESLVQGGEVIFAGVTVKETTGDRGGYCVEVAHTLGPELVPAPLAAAVAEANLGVLRRLRFGDGISHAEFRISGATSVVLMEVAARNPGDSILPMYQLASGVPVEAALVDIVTGIPTSYPRLRRYARQRYLPHRPGRLQGVHSGLPVQPVWLRATGSRPRLPDVGPEAAAAVREILVEKSVGDELAPLRSSMDRAVSILMDAADRAQLERIDAEAIAAVRLHTVPASVGVPEPSPATVVPAAVSRAVPAQAPVPPVPAATEPAGSRYLLVGFSVGWLTQLDGIVAPGTVTVLEEPELIDRRRVAARVAAHRCVDRVVAARYQQVEEYLAVAERLHRQQPFGAVIPGLEYAVVAAAELAWRWRLPGAGVAAAATLRDKICLREVADRAGLANPRWRPIGSAAQIREFACGGAVVVKPAGRQASLGVLRLDPGDDPEAAWRETTGAEEGALVPSRPMRWRYLVEERLDGAEFSVEALVHDGAIVFANCTRKSVLAGRYPVEVAHTVPAPTGAGGDHRLVVATSALAAAVGFGTGVIHAEWVVRPDGVPALVEAAGRAPGDLIFELIRRAYGFDPYRAVLELLAGGRPELLQVPRSGAAIRFLTVPADEHPASAPAGTTPADPPPAGPRIVTAVSGVDRARAVPGVARVEVDVTDGSRLSPTRSSWDRVGFVVAEAATAVEAQERARTAMARIRIRCDVPGAGADRRGGREPRAVSRSEA